MINKYIKYKKKYLQSKSQSKYNLIGGNNVYIRRPITNSLRYEANNLNIFYELIEKSGRDDLNMLVGLSLKLEYNRELNQPIDIGWTYDVDEDGIDINTLDEEQIKWFQVQYDFNETNVDENFLAMRHIYVSPNEKYSKFKNIYFDIATIKFINIIRVFVFYYFLLNVNGKLYIPLEYRLVPYLQEQLFKIVDDMTDIRRERKINVPFEFLNEENIGNKFCFNFTYKNKLSLAMLTNYELTQIYTRLNNNNVICLSNLLPNSEVKVVFGEYPIVNNKYGLIRPINYLEITKKAIIDDDMSERIKIIHKTGVNIDEVYVFDTIQVPAELPTELPTELPAALHAELH